MKYMWGIGIWAKQITNIIKNNFAPARWGIRAGVGMQLDVNVWEKIGNDIVYLYASAFQQCFISPDFY